MTDFIGCKLEVSGTLQHLAVLGLEKGFLQDCLLVALVFRVGSSGFSSVAPALGERLRV